jgi:hypothetical protein
MESIEVIAISITDVVGKSNRKSEYHQRVTLSNLLEQVPMVSIIELLVIETPSAVPLLSNPQIRQHSSCYNPYIYGDDMIDVWEIGQIGRIWPQEEVCYDFYATLEKLRSLPSKIEVHFVFENMTHRYPITQAVSAIAASNINYRLVASETDWNRDLSWVAEKYSLPVYQRGTWYEGDMITF